MVTPAPLPRPPKPQGNYVPTSRTGDLVMTAGMTPRVDGELAVTGRVGDEVGMDEARHAAELSAGNALAAIVDTVGDPDRILALVRMSVFVHAGSDFTAHSAVADAATELLVAHLGERGRCARSALGVSGLPGRATVEIELTARVR